MTPIDPFLDQYKMWRSKYFNSVEDALANHEWASNCIWCWRYSPSCWWNISSFNCCYCWFNGSRPMQVPGKTACHSMQLLDKNNNLGNSLCTRTTIGIHCWYQGHGEEAFASILSQERQKTTKSKSRKPHNFFLTIVFRLWCTVMVLAKVNSSLFWPMRWRPCAMLALNWKKMAPINQESLSSVSKRYDISAVTYANIFVAPSHETFLWR